MSATGGALHLTAAVDSMSAEWLNILPVFTIKAGTKTARGYRATVTTATFVVLATQSTEYFGVAQGKGADCLQLPDLPEVCGGASRAGHLAGQAGDAGHRAAHAASPAGPSAPGQPRPLLLRRCW